VYGGGMLYAGTNASVIVVWKDDEYVTTLIDHDEDEPYAITSLAYGDGVLYSLNYNGIRAWKDNVLINKLTTPRDMVNCIAYHDGLLYSGGGDIIRIWKNNECIKVLKGHKDKISCISYVGDTLYSGTNKGRIKAWQNDICIHDYECYSRVSGLVYGDNLLYSCAYNSIAVWSENKFKCSLRHNHGVIVCITYGDGILYSGDDDGDIFMWQNTKFVDNWGNTARVFSLMYNDGLLYSGHENGVIKVWKEVGLLTKAALK
tara:strand:- start:14026 stop:14802 length:777 start_codon:yes stop_codon:yes gene_type:complete